MAAARGVAASQTPPSSARRRLERRWTYCFRARKPCRGARKGRARVVLSVRRARKVSVRAARESWRVALKSKLDQTAVLRTCFCKSCRPGLQSSERSQAIPDTSRTNQQANTKQSRPASTSQLHVPHSKANVSKTGVPCPLCTSQVRKGSVPSASAMS